jgi:hypothetical protein
MDRNLSITAERRREEGKKTERKKKVTKPA